MPLWRRHRLQKLFYGVMALRHRMERQCGAMHDDLRHSRASRAADVLRSLGSLYTEELVTLGTHGEVQLLIVAKSYSLVCNDTIPASMRW